MSVVLICSNRPLERDLRDTVLFRSGIVREQLRTAVEAQTRVVAGGVALLAIHREVAGIETLIKTLRRSIAHKRVSIVVLSEDDFDPSEVELLEVFPGQLCCWAWAGNTASRQPIPTARSRGTPSRLRITDSLKGTGTRAGNQPRAVCRHNRSEMDKAVTLGEGSTQIM